MARRKPTLITTPFPTVEETRKKMKLSKKRHLDILRILDPEAAAAEEQSQKDERNRKRRERYAKNTKA